MAWAAVVVFNANFAERSPKIIHLANNNHPEHLATLLTRLDDVKRTFFQDLQRSNMRQYGREYPKPDGPDAADFPGTHAHLGTPEVLPINQHLTDTRNTLCSFINLLRRKLADPAHDNRHTGRPAHMRESVFWRHLFTVHQALGAVESMRYRNPELPPMLADQDIETWLEDLAVSRQGMERLPFVCEIYWETLRVAGKAVHALIDAVVWGLQNRVIQMRVPDDQPQMPLRKQVEVWFSWELLMDRNPFHDGGLDENRAWEVDRFVRIWGTTDVDLLEARLEEPCPDLRWLLYGHEDGRPPVCAACQDGY